MLAQISSELQVSYQRAGNPDARKLVFLHAFPLSSAMWTSQLELFSGRFDCIAPDFRGFGESTPFEVKPSFELIASDVNALLENLGITEKVTLCGLSMGGYCAFEFLRAYPEKLAGLILCDTRPDADSEPARKTRNELLEFALRNSSVAVAEKMLPKLLGNASRQERPQIAHQVMELTAPQRPENLAATIQALRDRRDSTPLLNNIKVPTLVVCGEDDEISTPAIMRDMALHIPGAQFVEIERAGHLSNLENGPDFNAALSRFLG